MDIAPDPTARRITVLGGGVTGMVAATCLAERAARLHVPVAVTLVDPGADDATADPAHGVGRGASWLAGGMLAPGCEGEAAGPALAARSVGSIDWWEAHVPGVVRGGSLLVAAARDRAELARFRDRTSGSEWVDGERVAALEPDLAGRFGAGLFFAGEAHLDPRRALGALRGTLRTLGVAVRSAAPPDPDIATVDCRGIAATDRLPDLRGVRGEMMLLRCPEISLRRPVRLLHPRIPLYVVPRPDGVFMVGATMIEGGRAGPMSARSAVDLLNAAYALHPAFAEAAILESNAGLRPAFDDNMPELRELGDGGFAINGMHRHGFLLAPELGERLARAMIAPDRHAVAAGGSPVRMGAVEPAPAA